MSLNLPQSLKAAAKDFAEKEGVSLNQFIALALAEKVGAKGVEAFFAERGAGGGRGARGGLAGGAAVMPVHEIETGRKRRRWRRCGDWQRRWG